MTACTQSAVTVPGKGQRPAVESGIRSGALVRAPLRPHPTFSTSEALPTLSEVGMEPGLGGSREQVRVSPRLPPREAVRTGGSSSQHPCCWGLLQSGPRSGGRHWLCPHCASQTGRRGGCLWRVTRWLCRCISVCLLIRSHVCASL